VYEQYGVAMSEVYKIQHGDMSGNPLSGPLRYQHNCVFWIQCQDEGALSTIVYTHLF